MNRNPHDIVSPEIDELTYPDADAQAILAELDAASDPELHQLMAELGNLPGPTAEQVATLDQALAPHLGDIPPMPGTGSAPGAEPGTATGTAVGLGKLAAGLGVVALVGAALWVASNDSSNTPSQVHVAEPQTATVVDESAAEGGDENQHEDDNGVEAPQADLEETVSAPEAPALEEPADNKPVQRSAPRRNTTPPAAKAVEKKSDDWTLELARLERAEQALQGGSVQQALRILNEERFKSLNNNALALRAAALCQGSPTQKQRGADLARKLSSAGSAALVRRLDSCMKNH